MHYASGILICKSSWLVYDYEIAPIFCLEKASSNGKNGQALCLLLMFS